MKVILSFIIVIGAYSQFFGDSGLNWFPNNLYACAKVPPGQQKKAEKQGGQVILINPGKGKAHKKGGPAFKLNSDWKQLKKNYSNVLKPKLNKKKSEHNAKPKKPHPRHFQNFIKIYDRLEPEVTPVNPQVAVIPEAELTSDDFDGRSVVAPGEYPHMAALGFPTSDNTIEFKCGGSLISFSYVVTAAHCACLNGDMPIVAKLGIINLMEEPPIDTAPQERVISEVFIHPTYNVTLNYHDIALLKLAEPIERTLFVRPIRLWATDMIPYLNVFTMGYGSTSFAKAPTHILTEMDLSVVERETCNVELLPSESSPQGITETQICAKDYVRNRDTCQGDSGGPLQLNLERRRRPGFKYYLVGIISYGEVCGSGSPGVYTKVSSYIDWIASIVWPTEFENFEQLQ